MTESIDFSLVRDKLYAAVIADILDEMGRREQVMDAAVRPVLHGASWSAGRGTMRAVPSHDEPAEPYATQITATDLLEPDDVVVAQMGGIADAAFWGELFSTAAMRGAVGAVMDGYVRDTRKVQALGFPLFATGIRPINSKARLIVDAYDVPIHCGGVEVHAGDIVFAEIDGIVVVPRDIAPRVFAAALETASKENQMRKDLEAGSSLKAAWDKHQVL